MRARRGIAAAVGAWLAVISQAAAGENLAAPAPRFSRHIVPLFGRLGCNGGTCHGAVQGKNGFRLALFGADPTHDYEQLSHAAAGRRLDLVHPQASLLLLKAAGLLPHGGGKPLERQGAEYQLFEAWIAAGARLDRVEDSRVVELRVVPSELTLLPGETCALRVEAEFADGSREDVTALCVFESRNKTVVSADRDGRLRGEGPGDAAVVVRYRDQPALTVVEVPQPANGPFPEVAAQNFIDAEILAKLRRLNVPPAGLCDDVVFLRRARLDVAGELPSPDELRAFLADADPAKRLRKIDELLSSPRHADVWTLKFCDLLGASDFGVYADGIEEAVDVPRFVAWVRARLLENVPYDEFARRILTATSRDGRGIDEWAADVLALQQGFRPDRTDLEPYSRRTTLDLYWQRRGAVGVPGTLQVAHAFLGLRLQCAQCHRHPHDLWRQDNLLSFANFFTGVRTIGFQGDNETRYPDVAPVSKQFSDEAKRISEEVKQLQETKGKEYEERVRTARQAYEAAAEGQRPTALASLRAVESEYERFRGDVASREREARGLDEVAKRVLHAEVRDLPGARPFASVTSPLGTQTSQSFRLPGEAAAAAIPPGEDPRITAANWMVRPDNPYFAKAIVNRVWAHYFGRGIVDPPDNLSALNPPSHPRLLSELCRRFIEQGYDLKWLHRSILSSRTYQQASLPGGPGAASYASFQVRRLPAEVLIDALNQATGTTEEMGMGYYHWPDGLRTVQIPYRPSNAFVNYMLDQFGRPPRNSAVQCDCQRDGTPSLLQVLSLANHPRVRQKIADENGRAARIAREIADDDSRIDELFLGAVSRLPQNAERRACRAYLAAAATPAEGLQGILWSLLNTKEFILQH